MKIASAGKGRRSLLVLGSLGVLLLVVSCDADRAVTRKAVSVENTNAGALTSVQQKDRPMEPSQIEAMILAKDWSVLDHMGALGQGALPLLTRLLENPDAQVRQLVVLCLEHVKGPQAAGVLARAIHDPDEQVRAYAADMLLARGDPSILPAMLSAVTRHEDPRIRSKAALVVGIVGDANSLESLKKALASEQDSGARNSFQQAMARLGDAEARAAILKQLTSLEKKIQFEALGKVEYINDRALVKNVARLLEDPSPVMALTASETASVVLRAKDAAAKVIAVLLRQPFTFKLTSYRVCTDPEIQEIKAFLQKQRLVE